MTSSLPTHQVKSRAKSWLLALRPRTLMLGVIPVLVGTFSTEIPMQDINWLVLFSAVFFALLMTIAVNLINDALDFKKGMDTKERIGPIRVTQSGLLSEKQVLTAGIGVLVVAFMVGVPMFLQGGLPILGVLLASIICSYLYTGGPYPISYNGLGELFVMLFYGFGAVMTSYYLQEGALSWDALIVSLQMGFLATAVIAINNLRDINEDRKTGKKTLAARFGIQFGKWEISSLISLAFLLNLYWYASDRFLGFFLPSTALLIAINLIRGIWKHAPSRLYNRYLGEASLLLTIFGILLILGLRGSN